jgi:hypothetical protein
MSKLRFTRSIAAGVFIVLGVTVAGCLNYDEKPRAGASKTSTEKSKPAQAATKTAVAAVQQQKSDVKDGAAVQRPPQQSAAVQQGKLSPQQLIQKDSPAVKTVLPAAEFQQLPAAPPSEPLPRPTLEPTGPPNLQPAPSNPLRTGSQPQQEKSAANSEPTAKKSQPPAGRPQTSKNSSIPFDPIKENGTIFDGWKKPKAALVITGMEDGYLEPCGCAGLDRMKGGMARRASLFHQLRKDGWPVVGLDVGGLVKGYGPQAEQKYQTAIESKFKMGYDVVAFGTEDLRLPAGCLLSVAGMDGKPSFFVSANVGLFGKPGGEHAPQFRIIQAGGMKIGVTAVLGKEFQAEIKNDEIEITDPDAALEKILPELKKQKADFLVLLAHATRKESEALGRKFPAFNVVVTSAVPPEEPPKDFETIEGTKTPLILVGHKGASVIVLGLYDGADMRYQRVPLDSRFPAAPEMKKVMAGYQEYLKSPSFQRPRPMPHPQSETLGKFIGTKKCAESCHEISYDIWRKSGHAKAYDTLAKLDPPRNFDPECISCHVIGWHPTKYFPYVSGFESQEKTPHLIDVGCEDCHGPGEKHAAAELHGSEELKQKLRKAMVVTKAESKKQQCYSCHDIDNSPDFDFDKYWPFVEHKEKE